MAPNNTKCSAITNAKTPCTRLAKENGLCTQHSKITNSRAPSAEPQSPVQYPQTPNGNLSTSDFSPAQSQERNIDMDLPISRPIQPSSTHYYECPYQFRRGNNKGEICCTKNHNQNTYCNPHQKYANLNLLSSPTSPTPTLHPQPTVLSDPVASKFLKDIEKEVRLLSTHQVKLQKAKQEYATFVTQAQEISTLKQENSTMKSQIDLLMDQVQKLTLFAESQSRHSTPSL